MGLDKLEHLTRWEVDRTIASGGMGTVYEARQLGVAGFEKRVALKVLKDTSSRDPLYRQQLVDEARLCANLVHENIVQIYQLLTTDDRYVVVMELCNGVTLRQFIDRHERMNALVPSDLSAFIASRVCRALDYAHTRAAPNGTPLGIVHRDICPNNILITTGGVVKLGDFGIAKASFIPSQEGQVLQGKARYMSPEQASFEVTDGRSDLFSLGVVLYETLAGKALFLDQSTVRTIMNVRTLPVPPLETHRRDVPEPLLAIVECALQRDPKRRFHDARTMGYQLEFYLYKDGFGPTNEKLRDYLRQLFPEIFRAEDAAPASPAKAQPSDDTARTSPPRTAPVPIPEPPRPEAAPSSTLDTTSRLGDATAETRRLDRRR